MEYQSAQRHSKSQALTPALHTLSSTVLTPLPGSYSCHENNRMPKTLRSPHDTQYGVNIPVAGLKRKIVGFVAECPKALIVGPLTVVLGPTTSTLPGPATAWPIEIWDWS